MPETTGPLLLNAVSRPSSLINLAGSQEDEAFLDFDSVGRNTLLRCMVEIIMRVETQILMMCSLAHGLHVNLWYSVQGGVTRERQDYVPLNLKRKRGGAVPKNFTVHITVFGGRPGVLTAFSLANGTLMTIVEEGHLGNEGFDILYENGIDEDEEK